MPEHPHVKVLQELTAFWNEAARDHADIGGQQESLARFSTPIETGIAIELWVRRRLRPHREGASLRHKGSKPMSVTLRLLAPLTGQLQSHFDVTY
jgi:hypothetical protein